MAQGRHDLYRRYVKRILDIMLAALALLLLGLPMLVTALLIRMELGSPVLFRQHRIGMNDKEFVLLKFRSMKDLRDDRGVYLPDEQRITALGRLIRSFSIDELPSLINVLKGDMSLIGPRPLPTRYLPRYTPVQRRRHAVRPGLSCPSTIAGRNAQSWEKQLAGDVWYAEHVSLRTDVKCILATLSAVLKREGAAAADGGPRGEFLGTADPAALQTDSEGNYMTIK